MTQQIAGTELRFTQGFAAAERQVLTDEAVEFLAELVGKFTPRRNELLAARVRWQQNIDRGELPGFISETTSIREGDWQIRGIPQDLRDRRVEITGPVERKMVINALNANVKCSWRTSKTRWRQAGTKSSTAKSTCTMQLTAPFPTPMKPAKSTS